MIAALTALARDAAKDPTLRAIVLSGAGPAFCAGADLGWMMKAVAYSRQENLSDAEDLARMFEALDHAAGAARRRASTAPRSAAASASSPSATSWSPPTTATFAFSEVRLGHHPGGDLAVRPREDRRLRGAGAVPHRRRGSPAARAREIGLVHAVVPEAALDETVDAVPARHPELRRRAPSPPPSGSSATSQGRRPDEVIGLTTATDRRAADVCAEGQEGMRAFLEKRKPNWS